MTKHIPRVGIVGWSLLFGLVALAACAKDRNVTIGAVPIGKPSTPRLRDAGAASASAGRSSGDDPQNPLVPSMVPGAVPSGSGPFTLDLTGQGNPARLAPAEVKKLVAGGPLGKLRWLYPYDGTVFPGGMLAPVVMWEGDPTAQAIYLHIKALAFDYKVVIKPDASQGSNVATLLSAGSPLQPQLRIPQDVWDQAGQQTRGKVDVFTIELATLENGTVAGPITSHFTIAPGAVQGSIYYTTYSSTATAVADALSNGTGDLMRIRPRSKAEKALPAPVSNDTRSSTCYGCHSVAANGSRLVLQAIAIDGTAGTVKNTGWTYQIDPSQGVIDPKPAADNASYVALYPDGSKYLSPSQVIAAGIPIYGSGDRLVNHRAPADATLYDTATAQVIPDTGIPPGALMPAFSPDGWHLIFNDYAVQTAHGLVVMDYDPNRHKASGRRVLVQDDAPANLTTGTRPGWPSFLPDNRAVVFVQTESADFSSGVLAAVSSVFVAKTGQMTSSKVTADASDLHIVDVTSAKVTLLAKAMGFQTATDAASGTTYLPYGQDDVHHNYFPTISPVAAGGYFWVFFDSQRHYGNLGLQRQLWATAIDIEPDGTGYVTDPSHPPFYVEGQDLGPDNHRAFSALDLCRPEGVPCATGIDCCTGFCSTTCVPKQDTCAKRDERCASQADCCESNDYCINGFCAFVDLK